MPETEHHQWLPIIIAVYLPVSLVITYSISVGNDHVEPWFPYISDTGTTPPESCVFSQLLNIGAVIAGVIIYIRYRQGLSNTERCLLHLNTAAFISGLLSALGVSLVGNFQTTHVIVVHYIGVSLAFGVGLVYMILQTIISYKSSSFNIAGNTPNIRCFRIVLCVAGAVLLIIFGTAALISKIKGPGLGKSYQPWTSDKPGYAENLLGAISQWLLAFVSVTYFATFYSEFSKFQLKPPEVVYKLKVEANAIQPV